MASSPVRIKREDKEQLERLREDLAKANGRRPTQQDTVSMVLSFVARHRRKFLAEEGWVPLTEAEAERWLSKTYNLGDWSAQDIDDIVYGEEP